MVMLVVAVHPDEVPVSVYVVMAPGVTIRGLVVPSPLPQRYEFAPFAVNVKEVPVHTGLAEGVMLTIGIGLTLIVMLATEEHPAVVPVIL